MTDSSPKEHLSALIKSLLAPYRNVMSQSIEHGETKKIETTLLPEYVRPTEPQLAAIGRVTAAWSVLEHVMGMTIARLSLAPEYTSMALTKELTANNQIRVLRTLIPLHSERYERKIASAQLVADLSTIPAKLQTLKDSRNLIAHTIWYRMGDKLAALRSKPTTFSKASEMLEKTVKDINALATDIQDMADRLFMLTQLLPEVDEAQHAQSLSLAVQSLHREILRAHPSRPEPSGK